MNLHRRLLASGRVATAGLVAAVALGVVSALLAVAQAGLLARCLAGAFLGGEGAADLTMPLAALAVVLGARSLTGWIAEVTAQRISGVVKRDLRQRLLARAVGLGPRWAAGQASGEVALLATRGLDALDGYYGRYLPQLGLAVTVPVAVIACLLAIDGIAAVTVLVTVPLIPLFMVLIGRMSAAHRARRWAALARLAHRFTDVVAGLPTLRAYGGATIQVDVLRRITETYRSTTMATLRVAFLSALALELLATISIALVAVGIGLRLAAGGMSLEAGLFALILAPEAYLPLRRLGSEFHASEEGLAAAAGALAIIDAPGRPTGKGLAVPQGPHGLMVEDLWIEQPGRDAAAPAGASLVARPGEVVAITGPSGAGKSTLLAVILALLEPSAGRVLLVAADGDVTDVRDLAVDDWRATVAWVPQAPYLFAGSVAENVRLGAPHASDGDVAAALAAVGLAGLEPAMVLGERGRGLSSGERRRVGIARALVRRATVLLLDEPTAGLDDAAEAAVLAAVRSEAGRGATVLLAAHRPGAVAGADRSVDIHWEALSATAQPVPAAELPASPATAVS